MKAKSLSLLPMLAALLIGCTSSRSTTTGTGTTGTSGNTTADNILRQVREAYTSTPNLTLDGEMKISGVPATVWFDALLKGQDSMKILLTGPFGISLGAMSATPDHFTFYNSDQGEAIEGTPNRETFAKLTSLSLDYTEMMALMRGEIPHFPDINNYTARENDGYLIYTSTTASGALEEITIDPSSVAVKRYVRYGTSTGSGQRPIELAIDYDRFKMLGGRQFARRAAVNVLNGQQIISVTINGTSDTIDKGKSLALEIPAGVTHKRL